MNIPKQMKMRSVVILLSCLLVVSSVSVYYGLSASTPTSGLTDIYINPPMQESSYIIGIYTAPTTCYLQNGTTGQITTTGTFYTCLQGAVDGATSGGRIFIRSGQYSLTLPIVIHTIGIYIEGEEQGTTVIQTAFGVGVDTFVTGISPWNYLCGLKNLWLIGESLVGSTGIAIYGICSDIIIEDCVIQHFENAIQIATTGLSGTTKTWNIWIHRCLLENNLKNAIYLTDTSDPQLRNIDRVKISECHFYDNLNSIFCDTQYVYHVSFIDNTVQSERQACINVTSGGRQWIVSNNHIFDCGIGLNGTMAAIMVSGAGTFYPDSWLIENNIIANHFTSTPLAMKHGIMLVNSCTNFVIQGNFFYGSSDSINMSTITNNNTIRISGNLDYANSAALRNFDFSQGQAINMTLWTGTAFPSGTPIAGQPFYRTDLYTLYVYNGTAWSSAATGATGAAGPAGTVYGLPFQYLVFTNATARYMVNGATSAIDYSSTNASKVLNFATGNTTEGLIYVKSGTYELDTTIVLGRKQHLQGEGELNTIFQMTAAANGITIDPTNTEYDWSISQLQIDMNSQNGHGIYSSHMTTTSAKGITEISHVRIDDVQVGYAGIWAQDLIKAHWDTIMIRTYGTGYLFTRTLSSSFNFGDSQFDDLQCRILGNNAVGFNISGYSFVTQNQSMNIVQFNHPYVYATSSSLTGTIGVWISVTQYVSMMCLDVENCALGVGLYQARDIGFFTPWIVSSGAAHIGVQLNSTTGGVTVFGGQMKTGGQEWDDDSSWNINLLCGVNFGDTPSYDVTNTDVAYGTP